MSQCNYCKLKEIFKNRPPDSRVRVISDARWGMGGRNVYVIPAGQEFDATWSEDDPRKRKFWVAWFMKLTKKCEC